MLHAILRANNQYSYTPAFIRMLHAILRANNQYSYTPLTK